MVMRVYSEKQPLSLWSRLARTVRFKDTQPSSSLAPTISTKTAFGSYGTQVYSGYLTEDYLAQMRGRRRADKIDEMRRSDAQIKMCLSSVKNPVRSATWEIEPADESSDAQADADLIEHILFQDMEISWVDFLGEVLTAIEFGHSVFEIIHKAVIDQKEFGSYNGLKRLAFRSQRTLERWNVDPETGDLLSITQYAFGDLGKIVDLPAENLLVFAIEKEGANYEGISALRPCYGPWFRKNEYLKLNAIGIEKFAIPTPIVETPDLQQNSPQFTNMISSLEHYLTHQKNYLTHPSGWKIDLHTNTYDPEKVETSIDNEDKRMVKAFLANFLELGSGQSGGAYALSNDLSDFFLSGLDHIATLIEGPINQKLIPQLVQMNRGQRPGYPKLKHSGISDKAGKELAECMKFFSDSKVLQPDDVLEDHIRKRYRLPPASLEGRRQGGASTSSLGLTGGGLSEAGGSSLAARVLAAEAKRQRIAE